VDTDGSAIRDRGGSPVRCNQYHGLQQYQYRSELSRIGSFWSIRAELKLRVSQPSSGHNVAKAYSFGLPFAAMAGSRARNRSAAPSPGATARQKLP